MISCVGASEKVKSNKSDFKLNKTVALKPQALGPAKDKAINKAKRSDNLDTGNNAPKLNANLEESNDPVGEDRDDNENPSDGDRGHADSSAEDPMASKKASKGTASRGRQISNANYNNCCIKYVHFQNKKV